MVKFLLNKLHESVDIVVARPATPRVTPTLRFQEFLATIPEIGTIIRLHRLT
jgi:hypothetical protein